MNLNFLVLWSWFKIYLELFSKQQVLKPGPVKVHSHWAGSEPRRFSTTGLGQTTYMVINKVWYFSFLSRIFTKFILFYLWRVCFFSLVTAAACSTSTITFFICPKAWWEFVGPSCCSRKFLIYGNEGLKQRQTDGTFVKGEFKCEACAEFSRSSQTLKLYYQESVKKKAAAGLRRKQQRQRQEAAFSNWTHRYKNQPDVNMY